ncbi:thiazole tautomerase TenI [Ectobacillus sp. sgz5001026]|uniref:thiazole tautomerase TenI n=1 Tax=Ectobacillus sp. sgz5001026 TaxID=3242473 RepID=UPI0036D26680
MKRELHVISNGKLSFAEFADLAIRIQSAVDFFHIREREKTSRELFEGVKLLLDKGIPVEKVVVNDRVDIALLLGISRVQIGYTSVDVRVLKNAFPHLHVGCSVHSLSEALQAEQNGADSVLYGHLFQTHSKENMPPRGLDEITNIAQRLTIPTYGIGGITPENVAYVLNTGVKGFAVMSGIIGVIDPVEQASAYRQMIRKWEKQIDENI